MYVYNTLHTQVHIALTNMVRVDYILINTSDTRDKYVNI